MMDYSEYKLPTCAGDGNQMGGVSPLDLPWEHVWFEGILRHLSLRDLFVLRATCQDAFHLVQEYFKYMFVLDLSSVGEKFGQTAFLAVTRDVENLRQLVLKNTKDWLTDSAVIPVIRDNLQLRRVDLTGCNNISNLTLQVLASHCPQLQDLCLSGCHWVSREGITAVGMQCRQLEKLNLTGCWDICDDTIITLVMVCRNLTFLSLGNIYGLTDESVTAIARSCCQLQQLNLRGCWRVTDRAVRILAEYCSSLKGLHVRECRNISERSLSIMRSRKVKLDVPPKFDQNRRALIKLNLQI